jgi:hypothetical protein
MSQIILMEFLTRDGVLEAPGAEQTHPQAGVVATVARA